MIEQGCLDTIDEIYGLHNQELGPEGTVQVKSGSIMAGKMGFTIIVHGKGGHGCEPANAIDPIAAGSSIVSALHTVKSRIMHNRDQSALVVTKFQSGSNYSIIPQSAELEGSFRFLNDDVKD